MLLAVLLLGITLASRAAPTQAPLMLPRFVPLTVMTVPTGPLLGLKVVMTGASALFLDAAVVAPSEDTLTVLPPDAPLQAVRTAQTTAVIADRMIGEDGLRMKHLQLDCVATF